MNVEQQSVLNPDTRKPMLEAEFKNRFGVLPQVSVRAPGRVDLMGSHTDYNDGFVLTLPIDRDTCIVAAPTKDMAVHLVSLNLNSSCQFMIGRPLENSSADKPLDGWGRYVEGVAVELQNAGHELSGLCGIVHSTVPIGSGLSSSASLEAAVATLFEQLCGFRLGGLQKARLCQRAENEWVGVNCGILDQYSSIFGQQGSALLLDCRSLTHDYISIPDDLAVVICNTCVPRQLTDSEYDQRREECETGALIFAQYQSDVSSLRDVSKTLFEEHQTALPDQVRARSRFIVEENDRVGDVAGAIQNSNRPSIERFMRESYEGARDKFQICVPAMEQMFDAMYGAPGRIGCRQAGAGFGGCMIAIVERQHVREFFKQVFENYRIKSGIEPDIYEVRSAAGAGIY